MLEERGTQQLMLRLQSYARAIKKLMAGSQLRPYDSIEGITPIPEGSNVNCIANHSKQGRNILHYTL